MMKRPEEVYPPRRAAQFDTAGRPFDTLFYTLKPRYYSVLHEVERLMMSLDDHEDHMIRMGIISPPSEARMDLTGSQFISHTELKTMFLERITDSDHHFLSTSLERLASHPYSGRVKDFIMQFRNKLVPLSAQVHLPPLQVGEDGRPYSQAVGTCHSGHCSKPLTPF